MNLETKKNLVQAIADVYYANCCPPPLYVILQKHKCARLNIIGSGLRDYPVWNKGYDEPTEEHRRNFL